MSSISLSVQRRLALQRPTISRIARAAAESAEATAADAVTLAVGTGAQRSLIVDVSPALAQAWLTLNTRNRTPRASHIADLAAAMKRGEWRLTHQGIAFDTNGDLTDGQHRLLAVARANMTVRMVVTTGVDPDSFTAVDRGVRRNMADVTGEHRYRVEVVNRIARFCEIRKITPDEYALYSKAFGDAVDRLHAVCGTMGKGVSASGVRAAAVIRSLEHPTQEDYVLGLYSKLVKMQFNELPPVMVALYRNLQDLPCTSDEVVVRSYRAFDPKQAQHSKIQLKDPAGARDALRSVATALLNR